jgi:hypothetical protein
MEMTPKFAAQPNQGFAISRNLVSSSRMHDISAFLHRSSIVLGLTQVDLSSVRGTTQNLCNHPIKLISSNGLIRRECRLLKYAHGVSSSSFCCGYLWISRGKRRGWWTWVIE